MFGLPSRPQRGMQTIRSVRVELIRSAGSLRQRSERNLIENRYGINGFIPRLANR